jgi:hypothetical protein
MFSVIKIKYLYYVHTIIYNILIYELEYYKLEFDMSCHDIIRESTTLVLTMYINT